MEKFTCIYNNGINKATCGNEKNKLIICGKKTRLEKLRSQIDSESPRLTSEIKNRFNSISSIPDNLKILMYLITMLEIHEQDFSPEISD